jgi:hypothetical protein
VRTDDAELTLLSWNVSSMKKETFDVLREV